MSDEVLRQSISVILKLYEPALINMRRHYDNHVDITTELTELVEGMILSENCKLGIELLMCLDEYWGGHFEPWVASAVDNLRYAENGTVKWVGVL